MARHPVLHNFYKSKEWTNLRLMLINERGTRCQHCGKIVARSIDLIGHHKVELTPENVHDYNISLDPEKVELICSDCHNKEHQRFGYQNQDRKVFLVYGPPLSGKTTFVKQNMERGDLVIDMTLLYEAVTMLPGYDKPDTLITIVMSMRALLLDHVRTRFGKWRNAWVVGGYPDKYTRDKLIAELGAELIYCEATKEECISRLAVEGSLQHRRAEWTGYINKWFEGYMP